MNFKFRFSLATLVSFLVCVICLFFYFSLSNWKLKRILRDPAGEYSHMEISFDGYWALGGTKDGFCSIWNLENFNIVKNFKAHHGLITCAAFDHDMKTFATGCSRGGVKIWDFVEGKCIKEFPDSRPECSEADRYPQFLCFSSKRFLLISSRSGITLYDTQKNEICQLPMNKERRGFFANFNNKGDKILICFDEGNFFEGLEVFDLSSKAICAKFPIRNFSGFAAFSPDGKRILSIKSPQDAQWFDLSGKPVSQKWAAPKNDICFFEIGNNFNVGLYGQGPYFQYIYFNVDVEYGTGCYQKPLYPYRVSGDKRRCVIVKESGEAELWERDMPLNLGEFFAWRFAPLFLLCLLFPLSLFRDFKFFRLRANRQ